MEDLFCEGKTVRLDTPDGEVELYMRYLKVRELPELFRIIAIEDYDRKMIASIALVKRVAEIDDLPHDALSAVFDAFKKMNLPDPAGTGEEASDEASAVDNFTWAFDFMISQGHSIDTIMEYPLPRYRRLLEAATDRVFGKKKEQDPLTFFQKMGIPVEMTEQG